MTENAELPLGQPAGLEVTGDWQGTRVTLRPRGAGRWLVVGFLGFWLCGWAMGEIFALTALLSGLGLPLFKGPWGDWGGFGPTAALFLLFWLTFWTLGGIMAFTTALRTGWGRDVLTFRTGELSLRQGVGPFGRTRVFEPGSVRSLGLRGKDDALTAEVEGKTVVLSTLGTVEERRWLLDTLRRTLSLPTPAEAEAPVPMEGPVTERPAALPQGWTVEPAPDGGLRVAQGTSRLAGAGCALAFALFWNGIVSTFVVRAFQSGGWFEWLFLTPFIAVGLGLIGVFAWALFGSEEWRVRRDSLETRRRFLGWQWTRSFQGGALAIEAKKDSDGDESWSLVLEAEGKQQTLHLAGTHADTNGKLEELRKLAAVLSYHTGWRLRG
jgi:hypothetical protein